MTDADRLEEELNRLNDGELRDICASWCRTIEVMKIERGIKAGIGRHIERSSGDDFFTS